MLLESVKYIGIDIQKYLRRELDENYVEVLTAIRSTCNIQVLNKCYNIICYHYVMLLRYPGQ